MVSYVRQVAVCEPVRKAIARVMNESQDPALKMKTYTIPSTDSVLRAISLSPHIDDEHTLKSAITDHILSVLRLTEDQKATVRSVIA